MSAAAAGRHAAWTVLSGPAGGRRRRRARRARCPGSDDVLSFDMGGTSCDVAVIDGGAVRQASEQHDRRAASLQLPMVDVHTVGAGGGSIGWADAGGALRVGPRSAGAGPGRPATGAAAPSRPSPTRTCCSATSSADAPLAGRRAARRERRRARGRRRSPAARPDVEETARGHRARRRRGDAAGAARRDRRARRRPARLRAGRVRRRRADARRAARRAARHRDACSARAPPACCRRSGSRRPTGGATSRAACCCRRRSCAPDAPPPWRELAARGARRELPGAAARGHLRPALPRARRSSCASRRRATPAWPSCASCFERAHEERYGYATRRRAGAGEHARERGRGAAEPAAAARSAAGAQQRARRVFDGEQLETTVVRGAPARASGSRARRSASCRRRPSSCRPAGAATVDDARHAGRWSGTARERRPRPGHAAGAGGGLRAVCEEMGAVLVRAAHSANIKERRDASTALFDAAGEMVMQAEHIPVHLGAMPDAVAAVLGEEQRRGRRLDPQRPLPGRHAPARHHARLAAVRRRAPRRLRRHAAPTTPTSAATSRAACRPTRRRSTRRAS